MGGAVMSSAPRYGIGAEANTSAAMASAAVSVVARQPGSNATLRRVLGGAAGTGAGLRGEHAAYVDRYELRVRVRRWPIVPELEARRMFELKQRTEECIAAARARVAAAA